MNNIEELEKIASQVRRDIIRMVNAVSSGHPGGSLGCADLMTALYFNSLDSSPESWNLEGKNEDMFFLSIGHISPVWYSVLARRGYFAIDMLSGFRKMGSLLQGHPVPDANLAGIRVASGSLGQGLSVAIGASEAKKLIKDENLVYVLMGDGELQEGQNWEGIMYASTHKVDNLIAIIDNNGVQIDGYTDDIISLGNISERFTSFGWDTIEINGNNMAEVVEGLSKAKSMSNKGKPIAIIMNTIMGYGVDFMQDGGKWHGIAPSDTEMEEALAQLEETLGDY